MYSLGRLHTYSGLSASNIQKHRSQQKQESTDVMVVHLSLSLNLPDSHLFSKKITPMAHHGGSAEKILPLQHRPKNLQPTTTTNLECKPVSVLQCQSVCFFNPRYHVEIYYFPVSGYHRSNCI